ncbi:MAG: ribosomal protein S18-alanine N-acetyltransferase [Clostridiaceae bacterium]|nr:ribosomal protein S18-alanine N-acetyltransferase [Clostridiaceae bacterium]
MEFEIFRMSESHIDGVLEIERECFSSPWSRESLEAELGNEYARFFAAVCDGTVIGYIGAFNVFGEVSLGNLAVKKEYRKAGVASALLNELEKTAEAENAEFITLEVRQSNEAAIRLYKKLGFSQSGLRKGFYQNPTEDAILMKKELK